MTVVVAAGDQGTSTCEDALTSAAVATVVGASDASDRRFALTGGTGSNHGPCVDVFAPGHDVAGASADGDTQGELRSGTSQAAGLVAGAAALVLQARPHATPAEVRQALMSAAAAKTVALTEGGAPSAALLQTSGLTGPPALATVRASLVLDSTLAQPSLDLALRVELGSASSARVAINVSEVGDARLFNGSSAELAAGATAINMALRPAAEQLLRSPSSAPFRLLVEASSEDAGIDGRSVAVLVRNSGCLRIQCTHALLQSHAVG